MTLNPVAALALELVRRGQAVVAHAPHQPLIEGAPVVITHAALNTTLSALGCGVSRLAWRGAGTVMPVRQRNREGLRVPPITPLCAEAHQCREKNHAPKDIDR